MLLSGDSFFLFLGNDTKMPVSPVKGAKAPNGKPLTRKQDFGARRSRQEWIAILSYERLKSICAILNSTVGWKCRIYFFNLGLNRPESKNSCYLPLCMV